MFKEARIIFGSDYNITRNVINIKSKIELHNVPHDLSNLSDVMYVVVIIV